MLYFQTEPATNGTELVFARNEEFISSSASVSCIRVYLQNEGAYSFTHSDRWRNILEVSQAILFLLLCRLAENENNTILGSAKRFSRSLMYQWPFWLSRVEWASFRRKHWNKRKETPPPDGCCRSLWCHGQIGESKTLVHKSFCVFQQRSKSVAVLLFSHSKWQFLYSAL